MLALSGGACLWQALLVLPRIEKMRREWTARTVPRPGGTIFGSAINGRPAMGEPYEGCVASCCTHDCVGYKVKALCHGQLVTDSRETLAPRDDVVARIGAFSRTRRGSCCLAELPGPRIFTPTAIVCLLRMSK